MALAATGEDLAQVFIELGAIVLVLALVARLAHRVGLSPIPFYLLVGLAFGTGGLLPLSVTEEFVEIGAELGVILLLFMLGLEYTGDELSSSLRAGLPAGLVDLVANLTPGLAVGLLLGWDPVAALLLGGVTYISSSGVIAKLLTDLDRIGNRETPSILSTLVLEDLAMAVYLPLVAVLLVGGDLLTGFSSLVVAVVAVGIALVLALRHGERLSVVIAARNDEILLLTTLGLILLVAGVAQRLQVSSAVGAFLLGIALSGPVAHRARQLLGPLRDLFAAVFFLLFGLRIDPADLPAVALGALALGVVTGATKVFTGWWAAARAGVQSRGRLRAGAALVARGEFSIVIAELGVAAAIEPRLGPLAAAYVLLMAIAGPILARVVDPLAIAVQARLAARAAA